MLDVTMLEAILPDLVESFKEKCTKGGEPTIIVTYENETAITRVCECKQNEAGNVEIIGILKNDENKEMTFGISELSKMFAGGV